MKLNRLFNIIVLLCLGLFSQSNAQAETYASMPNLLDGKYQISNLAELRWV